MSPFLDSGRFRTLSFFLLVLSPLLFLFLLKPVEQLYSDHLAKFVLGESISRHGFASGELELPSSKLDPESEFCPTECIRIRGKIVSPFPVALGFVYALILPWGGITGVYVVNAILVSATIFILSMLWRRNLLFLSILVFGSPFVVNGYFFPDVGLAAFLFFSGVVLVLKSRSPGSSLPFLFAGFLSASSGWFRIESIGFCLSFTAFLIFDAVRGSRDRISVLGFSMGILLGLSFLIGMQTFFYGLPLGPRFSFNQPTMFLSPWAKLEIYRGLLFFSFNRLGFFAYMPLFFFLFWFSLYFLFSPRGFLRSREETSDPAKGGNPLVQSGIAGFIGLVAAAPNDGIIDFGTRYLHLTIPCFAGFALILLDELKSKPRWERSGKIFLLCCILFSSYITVKYTSILAKYGKRTTVLHKIYTEQKPDLIAVQIRTYSQILGENFFEVPCVTLFDGTSLDKFFLRNDPKKFDKILFVQAKVLMDPATLSDVPFVKNPYFDSVVSLLGKDFEPSLVGNLPDVIIFSMQRKRIRQ
ncbi:hypothetical protein EHO61_10585 [Leptospira fluminis]|uniref:Glycosyltransferase RgtA/B/C/D-like domain-containing protein n=1 Tax=Leptospira fluminis TaxID=2484979 RepID=A0A4R9GNK2_9LEPT|nr:hypothetical protein [Leptospira fluminis]TGK17908.1 hypothetical protein EHO61_10585 [Leptospira fluminis]